MVLHHLEVSSGDLLLSMGSTPTLRLPMRVPRQGSCPVLCSLLSRQGNYTTGAILRPVLTDPRHLGSRINLPFLRPLHSRRIDQHICLPDLLDRFLLEPEEAIGREIIARFLVHPVVVEG